MKLRSAKSYWPSFLWKTLTSLASIGNQSSSILCHHHIPQVTVAIAWVIHTSSICHAGNVECVAWMKHRAADAFLGWWQELGRNRTYSVEIFTLLCLGQTRNYQIWASLFFYMHSKKEDTRDLVVSILDLSEMLAEKTKLSTSRIFFRLILMNSINEWNKKNRALSRCLEWKLYWTLSLANL